MMQIGMQVRIVLEGVRYFKGLLGHDIKQSHLYYNFSVAFFNSTYSRLNDRSLSKDTLFFNRL